MMVKVAMVGEDGFLDGFGPCGEAFEIVMPVALDVLDAECGHDGEVLQEGDGADVGEIFSREVDGAFPGGFRLGEGGGVGDTFDDALAVLVTGAVVVEVEGVGKGIEGTVGLVDYEGGSLWPTGEIVGDGGCEGFVSVGGLLNEEETAV